MLDHIAYAHIKSLNYLLKVLGVTPSTIKISNKVKDRAVPTANEDAIMLVALLLSFGGNQIEEIFYDVPKYIG